MKGLAPRTRRGKVLLLGGSSFVGRALFDRLGPARATPTYHRHPVPHGVPFDACTTRVSDAVENPEAYSHAVILLGDTDPESCAADTARSNAVNVEGLIAVIEELVSWQIKPIFLSSEFVFDGAKGNYVETDPVNPILTYGHQKVTVEQYLQERLDDYAIVRLAKVYGRRPGDGTLFANWLQALETQRVIPCASDQVFSPVLVDDVVEALVRLIERDSQGLFHLGGPQAHSRLELLQMLVAAVREQRPVDVEISPRSIHDFPLQERRPLDVSLRSDKLIAATGIVLCSAQEACRAIVRDAFGDTVTTAAGGAP